MNYARTYSELKANATNFWSQELLEEAASKSKIPILIQTQDEFIAILNLRIPTIDDFFTVLGTASLSKNIFLLHLIVLSDVGVEFLQRINSLFNELFPKGELNFTWNGAPTQYKFKVLPIGNLNHNKLKTSNNEILKKYPLNDLYKDLIAILLFGNSSKISRTAEILSKCQIGGMIGKEVELKEFVKRRYLIVSRITGGSTANDLGNIAQRKVHNYLLKSLKDLNLVFTDNGNVPNIFSEETEGIKTLTTFDLVISDKSKAKFLAIEISFQVTTNSTIERKAGQAMSRQEQMKTAGFPICYVLDGAGNFHRENALKRICNYSDCTVAFSDSEFGVLSEFVRSYFTK
jgi:hypothetical protein